MCASEYSGARRRPRAALLVAAWLLLAASHAGSSPDVPGYTVLRNHSSVQFTILKWNVYRELGRFTRFDGALRYDPLRPEASSIEITVDAASIETGMPLRDRILRSEDFLDAARHPQLTFRSTVVRASGSREQGRPGARTLTVSGELSIRGVTRQIEIPVTVTGVGTHPHVGRIAGFETAFSIDRALFGVTGERWSGGRDSLSRDVEVRVHIGSAGRES